MGRISLKEFIKKTQGKVVGFTDSNKHKGECVTLIQEYLRLCYDIPFKPRGNAHEWLKNLPKEGLAKVVKTPRYGDIIVWGTDVAKGYGHIAIYLEKGKYFDQYAGKAAGSESKATSKKPIGYLRMNKALIPDKTLKPLDEIAKDVRAGKYKNFPERKALLEAEGYNFREVQDRVNELIELEKKVTLNKGDKVVITGIGNASSNGNGKPAHGIGWERTILQVWKGRPYPYQVGKDGITTGFYKASALRRK